MRPILLLCSLSLSGCASLFNAWMGIDYDLPGRGVTTSVAQQWGCRADYVQLAAEQARSQLPVGQVYVAQVGWDMCEVMGKIGAPRDYDLHQTTSGRSASLWYGKSPNLHLLTVEPHTTRPNIWVVTYVGW